MVWSLMSRDEDPYRVSSVSDRRSIFERIISDQSQNSTQTSVQTLNNNEQILPKEVPQPPPKPKRTFAHTQSSSAVVAGIKTSSGNGSISPKLVICRPTLVPGAEKSQASARPKIPPPPIPSQRSGSGFSRGKKYSNSLIKPSLHVYTELENETNEKLEPQRERQQKKAPQSRAYTARPFQPLRGKPKYFQLSHEYEHIFPLPSSPTKSRTSHRHENGSTSLCVEEGLQRCLSNEHLPQGIYATPSVLNDGKITRSSFYDNSPRDKLYYASTSVATLPKSVSLDSGDGYGSGGVDNELWSRNWKSRSEKLKRKTRDSLQLGKGHLSTAFSSLRSKLNPEKAGMNFNDHSALIRKQLLLQPNQKSNFISEETTDEKSSGASSESELETVENDNNVINDRITDSIQRADRAKIVRRKTQILYDQQEIAFKKRKLPQLFELAALICLKSMSDLTEAERHSVSMGYLSKKMADVVQFVPVVVQNYPTHSPISDLMLASLPYLCYPDFSHAKPLPLSKLFWPGNQEFIVTLTDAQGLRKFAYCCRFLPRMLIPGQDWVLPQVLCVVSPVQASSFYLELVREAVQCATEFPELLEHFLGQAFCRPLPPTGGQLQLSVSGVSLNRKILLQNKATPLGRNECASVVERLGIDRTLTIFSALLSEKRVLIVGDTVPTVSRTIQAFASFLYPFEWPHTLIPVIPDSHTKLCFSPTPYLIGILRSNLNELRDMLKSSAHDEEEFILIIDIEYGILRDTDSLRGIGKSASVTPTTDKCLPMRWKQKLARALEQALVKQPLSDNGTSSKMDEQVSDVFIVYFAALIGHYRQYIVRQQDGQRTFQKPNFVEAPKSKSARLFLKWFVETGMFQVWLQRKMLEARDPFDVRLDELHAIATSWNQTAGSMTAVAQLLRQWGAVFGKKL